VSKRCGIDPCPTMEHCLELDSRGSTSVMTIDLGVISMSPIVQMARRVLTVAPGPRLSIDENVAAPAEIGQRSGYTWHQKINEVNTLTHEPTLKY